VLAVKESNGGLIFGPDFAVSRLTGGLAASPHHQRHELAKHLRQQDAAYQQRPLWLVGSSAPCQLLSTMPIRASVGGACSTKVWSTLLAAQLTLKSPSRMPYGPSSEAVSNNMVAFLFYQQPLITLPNKLFSYGAVLPPIQTQAVSLLFGTSSRFFPRSVSHLRPAYPPS
jgi:hypothetical protein